MFQSSFNGLRELNRHRGTNVVIALVMMTLISYRLYGKVYSPQRVVVRRLPAVTTAAIVNNNNINKGEAEPKSIFPNRDPATLSPSEIKAIEQAKQREAILDAENHNRLLKLLVETGYNGTELSNDRRRIDHTFAIESDLYPSSNETFLAAGVEAARSALNTLDAVILISLREEDDALYLNSLKPNRGVRATRHRPRPVGVTGRDDTMFSPFTNRFSVLSDQLRAMADSDLAGTVCHTGVAMGHSTVFLASMCPTRTSIVALGSGGDALMRSRRFPTATTREAHRHVRRLLESRRRSARRLNGTKAPTLVFEPASRPCTRLRVLKDEDKITFCNVTLMSARMGIGELICELYQFHTVMLDATHSSVYIDHVDRSWVLDEDRTVEPHSWSVPENALRFLMQEGALNYLSCSGPRSTSLCRFRYGNTFAKMIGPLMEEHGVDVED
eukprot:PhM_4_TR13473/c0_g1_i1/m.46717